jgi:hypothetical protein
VQHQPLIVPGDGPARLGEDVGGRVRGAGEEVADLVVEFQEGEVRLGDEEVLVVAVIADQREALGVAGQVVAEIARDAAEGDVDVLADQELRAVLRRVGWVAGVKVRGAVRPEAVDAIEVEGSGSGNSRFRAGPCSSRTVR